MPQTVRRIESNFAEKNENNENHRRNSGRKRKTSSRIDRKIINKALKNRRATSQGIQKTIIRVGQTVSISTTIWRLYESGLKCHRPTKRPLWQRKFTQSGYCELRKTNALQFINGEKLVIISYFQLRLKFLVLY